MRSLLLVVISTSVAAAEPTEKPAVAKSADQSSIEIALAVNPPFRWYEANALAGSAYIGFARHHALRLNVATFANAANPVGELISAAAGGDGDEAGHNGRTTDYGLGWQFYPRKLWSGVVLEAGLLRRDIDISTTDRYADPEYEAEKSTAYLARALVGWSWQLGRHMFIAISVGASVGRYEGTRSISDEFMREFIEDKFVECRVDGESYFRIGGVLPL